MLVCALDAIGGVRKNYLLGKHGEAGLSKNNIINKATHSDALTERGTINKSECLQANIFRAIQFFVASQCCFCFVISV